MRLLLLAATLAFSLAVAAQTTYYTNGERFFKKSQLDSLLGAESDQVNGDGKPEYFVFAVVNKITPAGDSLIARFNLMLDDKAPASKIALGPLAQQVGNPFPDFELPQLDGGTMGNADLVGKPTLINLWFTKCRACIDEMPVLNRIAEEFAGRANFVSITFNSTKQVERFLNKNQFHFDHLVEGKDFLSGLGFEEYPYNLFLDKAGRLVDIERGIAYEMDDTGALVMGDGQEFVALLEALVE